MEEMTGLLVQHGLLLVFANVLLTQSAVPVPAVPILIIAGAFVTQGQIALAPLILVTVAASLIGDTLWYLAGRRYGYRILRTLCRVAIEPDSCVKQTETIFERWGAPSLMLAKYIPGFSTIAPPLAGTMRVGLPSFLGYSAVAALLWAGLPIALGAIFSAQVERALEWLESMGTGAVAAIAAIVLFYVGIKTVRRYLLIRFLRMVRINAEELRELLGRDTKPVVLDVRSATARKLDPRRIPGAIWFDMAAPQAAMVAVPPERDVVVYCNCPNEVSAARVARELMDKGYRRVRPLEGGLEGWIEAGGQIESIVEPSADKPFLVHR
jgi:membrane protein DedA with SNARE-associated domain/rhodanese-related sulfurtransferase